MKKFCTGLILAFCLALPFEEKAFSYPWEAEVITGQIAGRLRGGFPVDKEYFRQALNSLKENPQHEENNYVDDDARSDSSTASNVSTAEECEHYLEDCGISLLRWSQEDIQNLKAFMRMVKEFEGEPHEIFERALSLVADKFVD